MASDSLKMLSEVGLIRQQARRGVYDQCDQAVHVHRSIDQRQVLTDLTPMRDDDSLVSTSISITSPPCARRGARLSQVSLPRR